MKIRADEHVSISIVEAIRTIALSDSHIFDHVIEAGQRGFGDVHWITAFAKEGGKAILSADSDFFSVHQQVTAVFQTGMKVIYLPPRWQMAGCRLQAAHVLLWWVRIEQMLEVMKPRECFKPPWNITEDGKLIRVPIDFAKAAKKAKRERQRAVSEVC